jgi:hypothetical protein
MLLDLTPATIRESRSERALRSRLQSRHLSLGLSVLLPLLLDLTPATIRESRPEGTQVATPKSPPEFSLQLILPFTVTMEYQYFIIFGISKLFCFCNSGKEQHKTAPVTAALQQLEDLLRKDQLKEVFAGLQALLPADAPEATTLIVIQGEWVAAGRAEHAGTVSQEEVNRGYNKVRKALVELVTALKQAPTVPQASQAALPARLTEVEQLCADPDRILHALSRLRAIVEVDFPDHKAAFMPLLADYEANRRDHLITQTITREVYMRAYRRCVQGITELVGALRKQEEKVRGQGVRMNSELAIVNCDRKKILRRFLRRFEKKEGQGAAAHYYLLHDQKYGQSESLVRRLITQLRQERPGKVKYNGFRQIEIKRVNLSTGEDLEDHQSELCKGFGRGLNPQPSSMLDTLVKAPLHYPKFHGFIYLPFVLRVEMPVECWQENGQEALRWWLTEFCQLPQRQSQVPVVFLIINLKETEKPTGWRSWFGGKQQAAGFDQAEAVKAFHAQLPEWCTLLPPLMRVKESDLHDWYTDFEENERAREQKVKALVQRLGPSKDGWHMSDVELELKNIIENQQNAAYSL